MTARTTASYLLSVGRAVQVEHVIHAVSPAPLTQKLLRVAAAEPCLELTRRTWTAAGPATKSVLTHPGSRYSLGSRYQPRYTQGGCIWVLDAGSKQPYIVMVTG